MVQILLADPEPLLHDREIIHLDGDPVGHIQVGAFGHTLGGAVGIGFVESRAPLTGETVRNGTWQVDIAGRMVAGRASLRPMLDPTMERIRR